MLTDKNVDQVIGIVGEPGSGKVFTLFGLESYNQNESETRPLNADLQKLGLDQDQTGFDFGQQLITFENRLRESMLGLLPRLLTDLTEEASQMMGESNAINIYGRCALLKPNQVVLGVEPKFKLIDSHSTFL